MLESIGLVIEEDTDRVMRRLDAETLEPVEIKYKHPNDGMVTGELYLPTRHVLGQSESSAMVKFHPLSENIHRGRSEVLNKLVYLMNIHMTYVTTQLLERVELAGADVERHQHMAEPTYELIEGVNGMQRPASRRYWKSLTKAIAKDIVDSKGKHYLIKLRLKKHAKLGDTEYGRVCLVDSTVPSVFNTYDGGDDYPFGVKPANKDSIGNAEHIYNKVLGNVFGVGTSKKTAPYFEVLFKGFAAACRHLNRVAEALKDYDTAHLKTDLSWESELHDLSALANCISTAFEGNIGVATNQNQDAAGGQKAQAAKPPRRPAAAAKAAPSVFEQPAPAQAPMAHARPAPAATQPAQEEYDEEDAAAEMAERLKGRMAGAMPPAQPNNPMPTQMYYGNQAPPQQPMPQQPVYGYQGAPMAAPQGAYYQPQSQGYGQPQGGYAAPNYNQYSQQYMGGYQPPQPFQPSDPMMQRGGYQPPRFQGR